MKIKNKILAVFLVVVMLITFISPVFANTNEIPKAFWKLSDEYAKALNENDYENIIAYGWKIIDLFKGNDDTKTALDIITPRLEQIAKAYEALGDYDNAVETFKKYIPKAEKQGWTEGVTYAKAKIQSLDFDIQLYTTTADIQNNKYLGAKYEPRAGIYFGSACDADPRSGTYQWDKVKSYYPKKNTAYLIYLDFKKEEIQGFDRYFQDARENDIAVELAWNTYDSDTMRHIKNEKEYVERTAKYLKDLNIPVFLRFACEMNIGENGSDADAYINAFRYISDTMKRLAPNVAMLWSPNDISATGRTYAQYYPGDEYVDWVGLSSYTVRYFQGKKDWGVQQDGIDSTYFTGQYANPITKIKPFIEEYGNRKPVMISETGIDHYARLEKEDLTEWAKIQLRRLYAYGPMVYPELKGIFYFNVDSEKLLPNHTYALYKNAALSALYNKLVSSDYYISKVGQDAPYRYEKIVDYTFNSLTIPVMTYTIPPKVLTPTVQYKVDGVAYATSSEVPYTVELDFSKLSKGLHRLSVEVYDGSNKLRSKDYQVLVGDGIVRVVQGNSIEMDSFSRIGLPQDIQGRLNNAVLLYVGSSKAYANNASTQIDLSDAQVKPVVKNGRTQ
jgi:hypothetical protein